MTNKRAPLKLFVSFYDAFPHGFEKKPVVFIWKVSIQHGIKLRVWWSMKVLNVSIQKCCSIWDLTSRKVHYHTPLHSLDDSIWTWKWKLLYTMENLTKFSLYVTKNFSLYSLVSWIHMVSEQLSSTLFLGNLSFVRRELSSFHIQFQIKLLIFAVPLITRTKKIR